MEDFIETNEPLNPYAKTFFGLWTLVALVLASAQAYDSSREEPEQRWQVANQTAQAIGQKQVSFIATTQLAFSELIRQHRRKPTAHHVY